MTTFGVKGKRGGPADIITQAVLAEHSLIVLMCDPPDRVCGILNDALAAVPEAAVRLVRPDGGQGPPLAMLGIIEALGGMKPGTARGDEDELLVRLLSQAGDERTLLVLERAETLPRRTIAFLHVASTVFNTRVPRLQIVLAGSPDLEELLHQANVPFMQSPNTTCVTLPPIAARAARPRSLVLVKVALPILLVAGLAGALALAVVPGEQPRSRPAEGLPVARSIAPTPAVIAPAPTAPPPSAPLPSAPLPSTPPTSSVANSGVPAKAPDPPSSAPPRHPTLDVVHMRAEFDAYLDQALPRGRRLNTTQRERLFNEFLRWRTDGLRAQGGGP